MQYNFGVGYVIGKRLDVTGTQPAFFGAVQEWALDVDQKLETLLGQYKDPVDVAPSSRAITGKIKFGRLQATTFGNMILGVAPTAASGFDLIGPELKVASGTSFTTAAGALFTEDLGVYYHATGVALVPVASAPAAGQYIAGVAGVGTYTFNAADTAGNLLDLFYQKSATDQYQVSVGQSLMGTGPVCELNFTNPYAVQGVTKKFNLQVLSARFSKMPLNLKNTSYLIPEMDFTCFLNGSGQLLNFALSE